MALATDLRNAGIDWSLDLVYVDEPSKRYPGKIHKIPHTRVQLTDLTATVEPGAQPVTQECFIRSEQAAREVEGALIYAMRKHFPGHPVLTAWLRARGHEAVVVPPKLLGAQLGECLHVALRKSCEGPQSNIIWNAICHMLPADWSHVLQLIREEVQLAMAEVASSNKRVLTYHCVGTAIQHALVERLVEVRNRDEGEPGKGVMRTDLQAFALLSFAQAARLTEQQEFVWGWTAYLCQEADRQQPAVLQQAA